MPSQTCPFVCLPGNSKSAQVDNDDHTYAWFLFYVYVSFVCMYVYAPLVQLVCEEVWRGHQMPLELEVQMTVSYHVDPGNQTQILGIEASVLVL